MTARRHHYNYVEEYHRIKNAIAKAESFLTEPAADRLIVRKAVRSGKVYYLVYQKTAAAATNDPCPERYIRKEHLSAFLPQISRYCAKKVLPVARELFRILREEPENYDRSELDSMYEYLYKVFGDCTPQNYLPRSYTIRKWLSQNIPNDFRSEELTYVTDRGDLVRSKLEKMTADALYQLGIPYLYEKKVRVGYHDYLPDFTILDPNTGETVYLEAFGLMDQPDYAKRAIKKIHDYETAGIMNGENLISVFDCAASPFNQTIFREQMRRKFL